MKIIAGKFKGQNFFMPSGIRPTQNIAREAIFNIVGQDLKGICFLDLFAGSGAIGLEALSRGAKSVTFVEKEPKCSEVIGENLHRLKGLKKAIATGDNDLLALDSFAAIKVLARQNRKFHVVFADPPYGRGLAKKALKTLDGYDILHRNCTVIIQHDKKEILPKSQGRILHLEQRKYGATILDLYQFAPLKDTKI